MLKAADARRREIQLPGFFFREGDELFDGVDRNARVDGEYVRAGADTLAIGAKALTGS